jgi:hypothetical protein
MMKKLSIHLNIIAFLLFTVVLTLPTSCRKDLLDLKPTGELAAENFWKTDADATIALMSAYAATRAVFDRDYYFDGHGDFTRARGTSATNGSILRGDAYQGATYAPSGYGSSFIYMVLLTDATML